MATIGVINLDTATAAKSMESQAYGAGGSAYDGTALLPLPSLTLLPLQSKTGPAATIGEGPGYAGASYEGHYVILTWAQYANGTGVGIASPAARTALQQFGSELAAQTATKALNNRLLTGKPATPDTTQSAKA